MGRNKPLFSLLFRLGPGQPVSVFLATLLASAFEILGAGLIFGFAKLAFDPTSIDRLPGGERIQATVNIVGLENFFVLVGAVIVALFLIKSLVGFGAVVLRTRYAGRLTASFSQELMTLYARQPYENLVQRHSSDFIKNLLTECTILGANVLTPVIGIAAEALFVVLIVGFLFAVDPVATLGAVFFFAAGYGLLFALVNPVTARAGKRRSDYLTQRTRAAIEFINGLREIMVSGRTEHFLSRFANANIGFIAEENRLRALPIAPAYGVQFLAITCAVVLILFYQSSERAPGDIVATIALFATAGLRMMPALNAMVRETLILRGHWKSFVTLVDEYDRLCLAASATAVSGEPLTIEHGLALRNVTYRYPGAASDTLQDVTIEIPRGSSIGIVGATGAGKSTAVEILLGLLRSRSGGVEVDGKLLEAEDIARWQSALGYVPQTIYLADDSVTRNIAFGLADDDIDRARVEEVGRLACIDEFVRNELPNGYDTSVGERGIGLSGGQIQRIGIARALYADPRLLILDEATSALDMAHEALINEAMRRLKGSVTTVVIAHRLSSIRHCDKIFVLEGGSVVGSGTYDDLMQSCVQFAKLAASTHDDLTEVS